MSSNSNLTTGFVWSARLFSLLTASLATFFLRNKLKGDEGCWLNIVLVAGQWVLFVFTLAVSFLLKGGSEKSAAKNKQLLAVLGVLVGVQVAALVPTLYFGLKQAGEKGSETGTTSTTGQTAKDETPPKDQKTEAELLAEAEEKRLNEEEEKRRNENYEKIKDHLKDVKSVEECKSPKNGNCIICGDENKELYKFPCCNQEGKSGACKDCFTAHISSSNNGVVNCLNATECQQKYKQASLAKLFPV